MQDLPRRALLRGLATLPLVGGAVELVGNPYAVATPVTQGLMIEYQDWLAWERFRLLQELYPDADHPMIRRLEGTHSLVSNAHRWHFGSRAGVIVSDAETYYAPKASTRAALVLSAVGCDWR